MKYKNAILGGTFDRFHVGHQKLLDTAFAQAQKVTIGITTEKLYQQKFLAETIEDYAIREQAVKKYLEGRNVLKQATLIPIDTIYGTTLEEKDIETIFVTEENLANVRLINTKRKEIGFPSLEVILVPYVHGDDGEKVTSERIRGGEINRRGNSYFQIFAKKNALLLPTKLREQLRKPLGTVVADTSEVMQHIQNKMVITVGDIVTQSLLDASYVPAMSIIDLKTRRHTIPSQSFQITEKIVNPAGTIQRKTVEVFLHNLKRYLQTHEAQILMIDGEEDLIALPAILLAPLESVVLYGQYDQGVVINEVTEEKKKVILKLLKRFN